nr:DUF6602 domain-containing protein [uncultured Flavobacterium sp.]
MNDNYYKLISEELLIKLNQIKCFVKKHNLTIGILTEEILRNFLTDYLPKSISVSQGFIIYPDGNLSKQCDVIIYDSMNYAIKYKINDIVIVPFDSVICVIEVKTTITKSIFHKTLEYFESLIIPEQAKKILFIFNSSEIIKINNFFKTFHKNNNNNYYDHDTFELLPDEIIGLNESFVLKKDYVISDRDCKGYNSYFFENEKGNDISSLELFYESIYSQVISYNSNYNNRNDIENEYNAYFEKRNLKKICAIELFNT